MDKKALFYLIYPVGLSDLGVIELKDKWARTFSEIELNILDVEASGILIEVPLLNGFLLNHILKTPTRILLRLGEFKARDFPKLFQKASKFPWSNFLIGQLPEVEVATHQSKLFDSRKIEKAIHDGITEFYRKQPVKQRYLDALKNSAEIERPSLYYRSIEDTITISLDTTGERLHKRGEKPLTGLAPIRENLAALLLINLTSDVDAINNRTLIDPMCGSGTFLIEALKKNQPVLERNFAYQLIPDWIDSQFKKQLMAKITGSESETFNRFIGFDINAEVLSLAGVNAKTDKIEFIAADAFKEFKDSAWKNEGAENFIILNPPYGKRVGEKSEISDDYYKKLAASLIKNFSPKKMGIIVPEEYNFFHPNVRSMRAFKNGGIDVVFYVLNF